MSLSWIRSEAAKTVIGLTTDPRPAWLWSADGKTLLWHNRAAGLFGARVKSSGLRPAEDPRPIPGQIARMARIGLLGRKLVSRMQFIAGRTPLSASCICTLVATGAAERALLVVGSEPIAPEILGAEGAARMLDRSPFPASLDYLLLASDGARIAQSPGADALGEGDRDVPDGPEGWREILVDGQAREAGVFAAGPDGARLILLDSSDSGTAEASPPPAEPRHQDLTTLIDRLAGEGEIFAELEPGGDKAPQDGEPSWDPAEDERAFVSDEPEDGGRAGLWQVTGRGLVIPKAVYDEGENELSLSPEEEEQRVEDEDVERVSRYNFEELSRILTDRIGQDVPAEEARQSAAPSQLSGSLLALSEDMLVLNRLPIGLLIFRDQTILFANRAILDLTGHASAQTLRAAGLASLFPDLEATESVGPVSHLRHKDGDPVPVAARLQTITWKGQAAVMLSAQEKGGGQGADAGHRPLLEALASSRGALYFEADATGRLSHVGGDSQFRPGDSLEALIAPGDREALAAFLKAPASSALVLPAAEPGGTLTLLAPEGASTCYAGILEGVEAGRGRPAQPEVTGATLSRIGRELRRPLNTVAGFSELIAGEAFGPIGNSRYLEYARDIRSAGAQIAALADELDQLAGLLQGTVPLAPAEVDLAGVLETSIARVRPRASAGRVLLRSAISWQLPRVRADRATLTQAVLNLLASAVDQSVEGGRVVVSAQREEDGSVSVHVRDTSRGPGALAEQFVVFRDGTDAGGLARQPVRSSIALTLTRSLAAVNAFSLSLDPASDSGTLMTLTIPASRVVG